MWVTILFINKKLLFDTNNTCKHCFISLDSFIKSPYFGHTPLNFHECEHPKCLQSIIKKCDLVKHIDVIQRKAKGVDTRSLELDFIEKYK